MMDRSALLASLESSVSVADAKLAQLQERAADLPARFQDAVAVYHLSEPLKNTLEKQDEFAQGTGFVIHRDNGYTGFYASEVAAALVDCARKTGSCEAAVDWLEKVLKTKSAAGTCVMAIWGVEAAEPFELAESVHLQPFVALPPSTQKAWLQRMPAAALDVPLIPMSMREIPKVALTRDIVVDPFISDLREGDPPSQKDPLRYQQLLDDTRLPLTLDGPCAPIQAAYWFDFEDPDLERAAFFGGISPAHVEIVPFLLTPQTLNPVTCSWAVEHFLALKGGHRDRIKIALERLNQALRRRSLGDKALELAIALESTLADDPGENTYKLGLRTALLLGGDLSTRLENRALVAALYQLRSGLVHKGQISNKVKVSGRGKVKSSQVVSEAMALCAAVIKRVLELGQVPDWKVFELQPTAPN